MENVKYEEALKKLEEIVERLESGELDLEDSIRLFEEGINLSFYCQRELKKADGRIQRLIKKMDGELEVQDFE